MDLLGTTVGLLGHLLDKFLTSTKCGHKLDMCWTNARHRTKVGQKLGYPHSPPAPREVYVVVVHYGQFQREMGSE